MMFIEILKFLNSIFSDLYFLLVITSLSFLLKLALLIFLGKYPYKGILRRQVLLFLLVLIGAMVNDSAWILSIGQHFLPTLRCNFVFFWIRIAWIFFVIQHQSLSLFIERLITKQRKLPVYQWLFLGGSSIFILFLIVVSVTHFNCSRHYLAIPVQRLASFYCFIQLAVTSFFVMKENHYIVQVPQIIKKQLKILVLFLIMPHLINTLIYCLSYIFLYITINNCVCAGVSTTLLTTALFYCMYRMMGLRFLNLRDHVQTRVNINVIGDFKDAFGQLSCAKNVYELGYITKTLFNQVLEIPQDHTTLYIRPYEYQEIFGDGIGTIVDKKVESTLHAKDVILMRALEKNKIFIYDEIAFNNFYETTEVNLAMLDFLESISADIFLPIYLQGIIAYIIIKKRARPHKLYGRSERDEMILFAQHLGSIITVLQRSSFDELVRQEKARSDELFAKHQEINQYKESMNSLSQDLRDREIGLLFYTSNRCFKYGNQAAKNLIDIDLSRHSGHPTTKALKQLARDVENYKTTKKIMVNNNKGRKIVATAVYHLERNIIIVQIHYPDACDIIAQNIDNLKDPSHWDYLLYLETTQSGHLINQLIPGSGKTLLNFKILLLKVALTKKALLLEIVPDDLIPAVELLHHISLREQLHIFDLHSPQKTCDDAIKLFGANPLLGMKTEEEPLLKKLHKTGTLLLKNVNFLNLKTQEHLVEFIRFGYYRQLQSEHKYFSDVRIICSTNQNLETLVREKLFSEDLFNELQKTSLSMPSLVTLPEPELHTLTDGFITQELASKAFKECLDLTDYERQKFADNRPDSLRALRIKIHHLLIQKSRKRKGYDEMHFDPIYDISDPQLMEAARLGKQALKDPKIMAMLWNKFQNQNTIARLLGVNRSSVNRRCKDFGL